jgi:hypothetical protein
MSHKGRKYARLEHYGNLLVPLSLLEKITSQCYIVETSWEGGVDHIKKVKPINKVQLHDGLEIDLALAQERLEGEQ